VNFAKLPACPATLQKTSAPNLRNISTNRERGVALCCLQKSLDISKGFCVNWLITYNPINNKVRVKK
jgi:hypothetical protein